MTTLVHGSEEKCYVCLPDHPSYGLIQDPPAYYSSDSAVVEVGSY